ncbi:DUF4224 domain-containing protein [Bordetella genomosp. 4]|uniref:DUF4224 domain-containing protein n=1 Tax=Bordetella genomosp. 4 TaxID=463044 RepID=A0A261UTK0_9BORD|nr:hypothetical protein CAL20_02735 [Bordetella genomosp. 4]
MITPPYLTDEEIANICTPLTQPAAQMRHLKRLGLNARAKPNGRPLVARADFDRVMTSEQPAPRLVEVPISTPAADVIALRHHWQNRRNGHGAAARGR